MLVVVFWGLIGVVVFFTSLVIFMINFFTKQSKKKALISMGVFLILTFGAVAMYSNSNRHLEQLEQTEKLKTENKITFKGDMDLKVIDKKILLTIETNAPEGAIFEVILRKWWDDGLKEKERVITVRDGKASTEFDVDNSKVGYVSAIAYFIFSLEDHPQPKHVTELYGIKGEKLKGDLQVGAVIPYPDKETVKSKQNKTFQKEIDEIIKANGVIIDIKPSDPNYWHAVDVIVDD